MDVNQIPETKASRGFRLFFENRRREEERMAKEKAGGRAEGLRLGLALVLKARRLTPSKAERAQIDALSDTALLHRCILAAATATTMAEALAPLRKLAAARATSATESPLKSARERPAHRTKRPTVTALSTHEPQRVIPLVMLEPA